MSNKQERIDILIKELTPIVDIDTAIKWADEVGFGLVFRALKKYLDGEDEA